MASQAGAWHRAALCADPVGSNPRYGPPFICVKHADAIDVERQTNLVIECFAQAGEQELGFSHGRYFEAELVGKA